MSKKLDEELAQAAGIGQSEGESAGEARAEAPAMTLPRERRRETPQKNNVGLLVTLLVVGGVMVGAVLYGFNNSAMYALTVDKLLAEKEARMGRKGRVQGELVPGSLEKRDKPCEYRFKLHGEAKDGEILSVRYPQCIVPDTFRDAPGGGVQVTVEGRLNSPTEFEATQVMAKCSSKYDPKTHEMGKGDMPAGTMPMN